MKIDLKEKTRRELEKLRGDIDKALAKLAEAERKAALQAVRKAAEAHGFSLAELTGDAPAKAKGKEPAKKARAAKKSAADGRTKVAPKYRNPNNPEQTWTGRGRAPKWMAEHIAAGGSKDDFAI